MKVAIMGAGGQGCFFGACLANAGNDVTFIARGATLEAMKKNGVTLKSKKLGNMSPSIQATSNPRASLIIFGLGNTENVTWASQACDAITVLQSVVTVRTRVFGISTATLLHIFSSW